MCVHGFPCVVMRWTGDLSKLNLSSACWQHEKAPAHVTDGIKAYRRGEGGEKMGKEIKACSLEMSCFTGLL